MIYAISRLKEIELKLKRKIRQLNDLEKSSHNELITDIRFENDRKLDNIQEALEVLEEAYKNTDY